MTANPVLSALVPPGAAAPAGQGRAPASDAGAAFLELLAGLLHAGGPPRPGVPAGSDAGPAPAAGRIDATSVVAGPDSHVMVTPGRPWADPAPTPDGTGPEGTTIVPTVPPDNGIASIGVQRSDALAQDSPVRGSAPADRGPGALELVAGRASEATGTPAPSTTGSDVAARTAQLQLPGAGQGTDPALLDGGRKAPAAPDAPQPRADALAEPRDAFGLRLERAAAPEPVASSRPSAPAPAPAAQMGIEITRAVAQRVDHMVVRMEPPELGQVRIDLSFGNDGQLSARIAVDRVETLEILQRDAHTLERALQEAGLRADSGGLSFSLRRESDEGGEQSPAQTLVDGQDGSPAEPEADPSRSVAGLRLLDIRA